MQNLKTNTAHCLYSICKNTLWAHTLRPFDEAWNKYDRRSKFHTVTFLGMHDDAESLSWSLDDEFIEDILTFAYNFITDIDDIEHDILKMSEMQRTLYPIIAADLVIIEQDEYVMKMFNKEEHDMNAQETIDMG